MGLYLITELRKEAQFYLPPPKKQAKKADREPRETGLATRFRKYHPFIEWFDVEICSCRSLPTFLTGGCFAIGSTAFYHSKRIVWYHGQVSEVLRLRATSCLPSYPKYV